MKIFIDTSSLIKLYHFEEGTDYIDDLFVEFSISEIYLSELSKVEFDSAIWKKVRTSELNHEEAESLINSFEADNAKFNFINLDSDIVSEARNLITNYGILGLRTLDSIQLASIIKMKKDLDFIITADDLLKHFSEMEGLTVK